MKNQYRIVSCPICKSKVLWAKNPFKPFCSERCKTKDLSNWADGNYAIPLSPKEQEELLFEDPSFELLKQQQESSNG